LDYPNFFLLFFFARRLKSRDLHDMLNDSTGICLATASMVDDRPLAAAQSMLAAQSPA